ncbi:MAG TPA: DUF3857 domain-containing protein [Pyrinomonadaceae bacterium]|nr:DUF3857 domain-containing protein [Pyrinomonadaceae bacterium]
MKLFSRSACLLTFVFIAALNAFGGDTPPSWMKQAASSSVPSYDKEVSAVVLHNEQIVTVNNDNVMVTTENYAVKILSREGRRHAIATALYLVSSGKVREIEGWLIRQDGTVKNYDKKSILDIISDPDDIYNEYRLKVIDGSDDADTGMIFGYTVVTEDRPLYFQEKWFSQDNLPTLLSRYTLNLPSGWKASGITFNHPAIAPQVSGTSYTWELRNLPSIKREPMGPSVTNIVPWVAINYTPENASQSGNKVFTNWTEVSRWTSGLYEPQVIVDDAVAAKAQELTANAKTELEKIRAIASFVQNLQYISIDIGVGSGNGYRPRPSNLVLNRGYGDCKDKANLMRALLKASKIEAYPIAIFSGDPTFVREEWASPAQFNHCIIAVKISDSTDAPTVIKHATLGRLLIFDATDPYTTLGDLPDYLQGSFGLIIAGENGGLARMPVTPAESNLLDRKIEASISAEGTINGTISEKSNGQSSSYERSLLRSLSATDYNKMLEIWLTRGATGAKLVKFTSNDRKGTSGFDLDVEFSAPRYGQLMQNRLLVFKPVIVGRRNALSLTEIKRDNPVLIDSESVKETAVFSLPTGFIVDELPEAVTLETSFGKYTTNYEIKDGKLIFTRSLTTNRTTVPVDKYNSVRDFYAKMREAEQSPVVLLRK